MTKVCLVCSTVVRSKAFGQYVEQLFKNDTEIRHDGLTIESLVGSNEPFPVSRAIALMTSQSVDSQSSEKITLRSSDNDATIILSSSDAIAAGRVPLEKAVQFFNNFFVANSGNKIEHKA